MANHDILFWTARARTIGGALRDWSGSRSLEHMTWRGDDGGREQEDKDIRRVLIDYEYLGAASVSVMCDRL